MDETEVIHHQMEHTRHDLAEKVEALEKKVEHTVEAVTGTIQSTVDTVSNTVEKTKESITGTVEAVTESVGHAVENVSDAVKKTFDVSGHVRNYPWAMFGGSMLVGFLAGRWLGRSREPEASSRSEFAPLRGNGRQEEYSGFAEERARFGHNGAQREQQEEEGESWLGHLGEQLAPVKEMALGTTLGVAREMLVQYLPESLKQGVTDVMDDLTRNLGGKPIKAAAAGQQTS